MILSITLNCILSITCLPSMKRCAEIDLADDCVPYVVDVSLVTVLKLTQE